MTTNLIRVGMLLVTMPLAGCFGSGVEHTQGQSEVDPALVAERMSIRDGEGVTTWDILQRNGVTVSAERTNESTTTAQDMTQTIIGAAVPSIIQGQYALEAQKRACPDGNCGGSGSQTLVQTAVSTTVKGVVGGACTDPLACAD